MWFISILFIFVALRLQSGGGVLLEITSDGNETANNSAFEFEGILQLQVEVAQKDEETASNSSKPSCHNCMPKKSGQGIDHMNLTGKFKISLAENIRIKTRENDETLKNDTENLKGKSSLQLVKIGSTYYHFSNTKANFHRAFQFCRQHDMDLLSIESKEENDLIVEHLRKNYPMMVQIWTSGTDLHQEGQFIWLATGQPISFTYWSVGSPNNFLFSEHCLQIMKIGIDKYLWNDVVCSMPLDVICEVRTCSELCKLK